MQNKGIIGAVCGDIIGSAYEFHKTKDYEFKLFTPQSKFTDDTVMTCAVAEWLMDDPKHSHEKLVEIMHRYGEEYPHRGYGGMFKQWLENKWTEPYNSFGNGSAMRVSPVGYYAKSLEEALQLAQISAEVTHNHPEGIIGAQAVAATIYLLRNDEWLEKGKKFLKDFCFYDLDEIKKDWNDIREFYTFDVTCQGSVPEAIYCGVCCSLYEDSIRFAVSLGGDADTQAAIAGGIAASDLEVPDHILNECLDRLDPPLVDVIDKFNEFVK
jgi:ADP-ribosylglycohydrolase